MSSYISAPSFELAVKPHLLSLLSFPLDIYKSVCVVTIAIGFGLFRNLFVVERP